MEIPAHLIQKYAPADLDLHDFYEHPVLPLRYRLAHACYSFGNSTVDPLLPRHAPFSPARADSSLTPASEASELYGENETQDTSLSLLDKQAEEPEKSEKTEAESSSALVVRATTTSTTSEIVSAVASNPLLSQRLVENPPTHPPQPRFSSCGIFSSSKLWGRMVMVSHTVDGVPVSYKPTSEKPSRPVLEKRAASQRLLTMASKFPKPARPQTEKPKLARAQTSP